MPSKMPRLKIFRLKRGLRQIEVARDTGIRNSRLSLIENALVQASEKERKKLEKYYGCELRFLK